MKNNKLLACPYIVWMILFTIIPLGIVFYYALTDSITGQFTLANLAGMGTYLPIFLRMMITEKNLHPFKRFVMPALSILSCIFMIVAAIFAHGMGVVWYLIVFVVFMLLAAPFYRKNPVK